MNFWLRSPKADSPQYKQVTAVWFSCLCLVGQLQDNVQSQIDLDTSAALRFYSNSPYFRKRERKRLRD